MRHERKRPATAVYMESGWRKVARYVDLDVWSRAGNPFLVYHHRQEGKAEWFEASPREVPR